MKDVSARVCEEVDRARGEIIDFAAELVRIPTVNPPGENYRDCAEAIGSRLESFGFEVEFVVAENRPEHTEAYPRVNVLGLRPGRADRPLIHINGHMDVVPPCDEWTLDPFDPIIRDGRLYGRGSTDMKAGIAAALYATESIRRAGVSLEGSVELSATVDEESGGYAGVAWLAEQERIDSSRTDYVIIPEPLGVDRICIGHRGVYWAKLSSRGRTAHGSMPFLGVSAIEHMGALLQAITGDYTASISKRETRMPVIPIEARRATVNVNAIQGGQVGPWIQSPCVADRCDITLDRRFLMEERIDVVRREISELVERVSRESPDRRYEVSEISIVHPVQTPENSPLTKALETAIRTVLGKKAEYVASPGTYDHKHVAQIAGVEHCVAYGPGILEVAHQPDEYCLVEDVINSTKVLALAILELTQTT